MLGSSATASLPFDASGGGLLACLLACLLARRGKACPLDDGGQGCLACFLRDLSVCAWQWKP
eukprot:2127843-Amphidinium_carterae.1